MSRESQGRRSIVVDSERDDGLLYNFIVFFVSDDYIRIGQTPGGRNTRHFRACNEALDTKSKLINKLFHWHWSYRLNSRFRVPFKRLWFRAMYKHDFEDDLPLCFVYMGANKIRYDSGWCEYVRRRDPRNRQVICHSDLISKTVKYDYSTVLDKVDLAVTYDAAEAKRHGILSYQHPTYSKLIPLPDDSSVDQDVYFLGYAKDRLDEIMKTYDALRNGGATCKFILVGVPLKNQVEGEGLIYCDGISYQENLDNVVRSKCILEITQHGASGATMRTCEAIAYHRRLLTNRTNVDETIFAEGQLISFSIPEKIDVKAVTAPFDQDDYPEQCDMNPLEKYKFIQDELHALDCAEVNNDVR